VGTGPYLLDSWAKGSSVTLKAWPGYRNAAAIKIKRATFRFITDPAAQVAAVLAGDVDAFPASRRAAGPVQAQPPLSGADQRLARQDHPGHQQRQEAPERRARAPRHQHGHRPQGRHPGRRRRPGRAHRQPLRAQRARLRRHHRHQPLRPRKGQGPAQGGRRHHPAGADAGAAAPPYARQGGEVIVAELAKIGITAKVQNVEWAQWLANVYGGARTTT
jgi:peptide/nickel transport system substrate-binding protein